MVEDDDQRDLEDRTLVADRLHRAAVQPRQEGDDHHGSALRLSFNYGQRHTVELEKARLYAPQIGAVGPRDGRFRPAPYRRQCPDLRPRFPRAANDEAIPGNLRTGLQHHLPVVRFRLGRGAELLGHFYRG